MAAAPPARFSTLLHIVLLFAFAACAGDSASEGEGRDAGEFAVALITPGPISDQSWNASAYTGLGLIRDSLGARTSHIQTDKPSEFEENFEQYGQRGYDLVFGHGFEFQDAAMRVGPSFPNTVYITTSGRSVGPNVSPIVFGFEDATYLAGMAAGLLTRSNVIGAIGGTELPTVRSSFRAYEAGARSVNPDVRVLVSYVGNWSDASAGKEQALAQIRRGADVIFQNADAAGLGIIRAAQESGRTQSGRTLIFGANANQNHIAPEVIIASAVIDVPRAMVAVAREVREQRFRPRIIFMGGATDVVRLEWNEKLDSLVPHSVRARIDSARSAINEGRMTPPRLEFGDTVGIH